MPLYKTLDEAKAERIAEKKVNFSYEERDALHAISVMKMYRWNAIHAEASDNPKWPRHVEKQCFGDSLESMVREGLIDSYHLTEFTVTVNATTYRCD